MLQRAGLFACRMQNSMMQTQTIYAVNPLLANSQSMNFATKIMGGSTNNKKDSAGRRLGLKKWGHNAENYPNEIILRQRGFKWHPGMHVKTGKDHTLHAEVEVSLFLIKTEANCGCVGFFDLHY